MLEKLKKWWTLDAEAEANSDDSSLSPVKWNKRRGALSLIVLSFGWGYCSTGLVVGGQMIDGANFKSMMIGFLGGDLILFCISMVVCFLAYRTGFNNAITYRYVFGKKLYMFPCLLIVVMGLGHQSLMTGMIGDVVVGMQSNVYVWVCLIAGIAIIATLYVGIKGVEVIGNLAVVFLTIAMVVCIVYDVNELGGWTGVAQAADAMGTGTKTTAALVDASVGAWSVGAAFAGDFTRFAKRKWVLPVFVAINFLVVQPLLQLLGLLGMLGFNDYTFTNYAWNLGPLFGVIAFIAMIFAMWTTANSNLYFVTQAATNVFKRPTKAMATIMGAIGMIGAMCGFYSIVGPFIDFLACIVPPLIGVVIADYFTINKTHYDSNLMDKLPGFNISALVAYIIGVIIPKLYTPSICPVSIWCIIISFLAYVVIVAIAKACGKKPGYSSIVDQAKGPWDPYERAVANGEIERK